MSEKIAEECRTVAKAFAALESVASEIEKAALCCHDALKKGNAILLCGNGGSAAEAQHIAAEFVGRYRMNRGALKAVALTVDSSVLTAVGNDYGFDCVFSRQIEAMATSGDVLIAISTSGHSENVLRAISVAKFKGAKVIGLTGRNAGDMKTMCDVLICAPSEDVPRIQELHTAIGHVLCGAVEEMLCA